jgi:hypothetical protein
MRYKIKAAIKKQNKEKGPADALAYMKKAEKKIDESKKPSGTAFISAAEKRKLDLEVKPKLQLAQKL